MPIAPESTRDVDATRMPSPCGENDHHCSQLTVILESAWGELQRVVPEIPDVVLLVLSAREHSRRGHFTMEAWRNRADDARLHEVAVHPGMFEAPQDLLATLLHEAAHAILWEKRSEASKHCCGVSLRGYYHRVEFRSAARGLGLEVNFKNRRYGFCLTKWPDDNWPEEYSVAMNTLSQFHLVASQQLPSLRSETGSAQPPANYKRAMCSCAPPRSFRISVRQISLGAIRCDICGSTFQLCT